MNTGSHILLFSCICTALLLASCGIESQESSFKYRLQTLDELAAKAPGDVKANITAEKARFEEAYKKLPAAEGPRGEGLGTLNQESYAFIDATRKKLEEIAGADENRRKASQKEEFSAMLSKLAGDWHGNGMRLMIADDGTVEYERLAGGVKKSITGGSVVRIGADSFDVKVLVGTTTFRIDGPPRLDGAAWKMRVDGVEVVKR